jgi:putative peptide zinc metalloprotease protein
MLVYRWLGPVSIYPEIGQVLAKLSLANFFTILGNLSPLMPTDGYFILSTLLKKVNIRTNALFEFLKWVRREKNQLRGGILVYVICSGALILAMLGVQFRWILGIFNELLIGQLSIRSFQTQFLFLAFIALALLRLAGAFLFKRAKAHSHHNGSGI